MAKGEYNQAQARITFWHLHQLLPGQLASFNSPTETQRAGPTYLLGTSKHGIESAHVPSQNFFLRKQLCK